jgi:hypothetical protein
MMRSATNHSVHCLYPFFNVSLRKTLMMFTTNNRMCASLITLSLLLFVGCGEGGPDDVDPNLSTVSGTINLSGSPLTSGGTVTFVSEDETKTYSGDIDSSGVYTVNASQSGQGALPGNYKVAIQAWDSVPGMDEEGNPVEGKSAIPEKYSNPDTSGLTATVTDGPSMIDFDLKTE